MYGCYKILLHHLLTCTLSSCDHLLICVECGDYTGGFQRGCTLGADIGTWKFDWVARVWLCSLLVIVYMFGSEDYIVKQEADKQTDMQSQTNPGLTWDPTIINRVTTLVQILLLNGL